MKMRKSIFKKNDYEKIQKDVFEFIKQSDLNYIKKKINLAQKILYEKTKCDSKIIQDFVVYNEDFKRFLTQDIKDTKNICKREKRALEKKNCQELHRLIVLLKLETLIHFLFGKGLIFDEKIRIIKKCWENTKFDKIIKLDTENRHKLIYQKISKKKRIKLLMLACKIYLLVSENKISTKRNIYYEENRFIKANCCYELIEIICSFVNGTRRDLNIIATSKGLIAGNLTLIYDEYSINCSLYKMGTLIVDSIKEIKKISTDAKCILVVEKEATFQKLVSDNFHFKNKIILITSKGFPDIYTREFVNALSTKFRLKVFGMFDADPFGIEILCCFKYGSMNSAHCSSEITVPKMIWLGLWPTETKKLKLPVIKFTKPDQSRNASLLKREYIKKNSFLLKEIKFLYKLKTKCGLQNLFDSLSEHIEKKISFCIE